MKFKNIVLVLVCVFALQGFYSSVNAAACQGPDNQTSQFIPANGVTVLASTDITNQDIDTTQNLEVAALSGGGNKITAIPFTFSGNKNRSLRITVTYPNQTFPGSESRRLAIAETSAGFAQCDGGLDDIDANTNFVSPLQPITVPTDAVSIVIEGKFKADKTYQVELLYIFEKVEAGLVEPTRIQVETIDGGGSDDDNSGGDDGAETPSIEDIKVIQASTFACPKTPAEYLEEAVISENASTNTLINDKIDIELAVSAVTIEFNKRTNKRVNKTRKQIARNIEVISSSLRTSKAALECAKQKINADDTIADNLKANAIKEIDEAIANDDAALDKISKLKLSPGLEAALPIDLGLIQEDVTNARLDKGAAERALNLIESEGLKAQAAAQAAAARAAAAAQAVKDAVKSGRQGVKGGLDPSDVQDAQDSNDIVAAGDELIDGANVIAEAGIERVNDITNDPNTSKKIKKKGEELINTIEKRKKKIVSAANDVKTQAQAIDDDGDITREQYGRRAVALEKLLTKRLTGEGNFTKLSRYTQEFNMILRKINQLRKKAGLPPLTRF